MNPRILKKLSKRAVPLIERLSPGLWHGLSEDDETCYSERQMQRVRHAAGSGVWDWRGALEDPIYAHRTPMCAWPGLDSCGEGDEGRSAWRQFAGFIDDALTTFELPNSFNGDEWPVITSPRLRNPSAVLRAARNLIDDKAQGARPRTNSKRAA